MQATPAFVRVDPDTLCLGCLAVGDHTAGCAACGYDVHTAPISPLHLPPRSILHGQYLLGRTLGQGGFGITYLGWDLNLDVAVAIKEFLPTDFASRASGHVAVTPYGDDGRVNFESGLDAFEGEARTLARCFDLEGVVDVLNYFRENGTGYIVMPYLPGRTFRDHLKARETPMPFDEALAIMRPVLIALQEVHRLGLVHRDVSPDNIYVGAAGRVCLLDFGAARHAVRERSKSLSVQFKAGYTPEEQYQRHGRQGPWTDVYAAAATLYRAITGVVPPPALDRRMRETLRPPGAMGASVPRAAERALMRGLALEADQRYRTIAAFLDDLAPGWQAGAGMRASADGAGVAAGAGAGAARWLPGGAAHGGSSLAAGGSRPNGGAASSLSGGLFGAVAWIGAAIADTARIVRLQLDAALQRRGATSSSHERRIREQLAALWPVTLVEARLREPHLPAGPDHGPYDVYAREDTHEVAFTAILQNNFAGIRPLRGPLAVRFVAPGVEAPPLAPSSSPSSTPMASSAPPTLELDVRDLVDRVALDGRWQPPGEHGFQPGLWRLELWWDGRKIGERGFVVSA